MRAEQGAAEKKERILAPCCDDERPAPFQPLPSPHHPRQHPLSSSLNTVPDSATTQRARQLGTRSRSPCSTVSTPVALDASNAWTPPADTLPSPPSASHRVRGLARAARHRPDVPMNDSPTSSRPPLLFPRSHRVCKAARALGPAAQLLAAPPGGPFTFAADMASMPGAGGPRLSRWSRLLRRSYSRRAALSRVATHAAHRCAWRVEDGRLGGAARAARSARPGVDSLRRRRAYILSKRARRHLSSSQHPLVPADASGGFNMHVSATNKASKTSSWTRSLLASQPCWSTTGVDASFTWRTGRIPTLCWR
jgi:hypothetical protein